MVLVCGVLLLLLLLIIGVVLVGLLLMVMVILSLRAPSLMHIHYLLGLRFFDLDELALEFVRCREYSVSAFNCAIRDEASTSQRVTVVHDHSVVDNTETLEVLAELVLCHGGRNSSNKKFASAALVAVLMWRSDASAIALATSAAAQRVVVLLLR